MKNGIIIGIVIVVSVTVLVGCQKLLDLYPADVPKDLYTYLGQEPNQIRWECIGQLKGLMDSATLKHNLNQAEFDYISKRDNLTYTSVNASATISFERAIAEQKAVFGEGGIASIALAAIAGGGGMSVILRKIWYTEKEHQKDKAVAVDTAVKMANNKTILT